MFDFRARTRVSLFIPTAALAMALSVTAFQPSLADDKAPPKKADAKGEPANPSVMQRKLQQAQKLLEGLALNDFDKVNKSTAELVKLRAEAGWAVLKTPRYVMLSDDFLGHLEAAQKASKAKNIDGVALAYVEMTLSCVKCHQYVRDQGIGKAPLPPTGIAARVAAP